jgi:CO/xanthine dehydrogenase Mo-binding subunit
MKRRGIGIAAAFYPMGLSGGGDSSQAMVKVQPDGSVVLIVGACDIGQGCKTVLAQMAAEVLGVDYEQVKVINDNTDDCPLSFGTFASRVTYVDGKAAVQAAENARDILFQVAAEMLDTPRDDLEIADGRISAKSSPDRSKTIGEVANAAVFSKRRLVVGLGHYMRDPSPPDPETGACDPICSMAWGGNLAEVEVDTETGEVHVLRLVSAYDVGKAINPMLVEGQIDGGAAMGLGAALSEDLHPYYPTLEGQPTTLGDYAIPTAVDMPDLDSVIYECPSTDAPFGAKGLGEMTANCQAPAIINAIHDAIGVWIAELPVSPEKVLRALEEQATS